MVCKGRGQAESSRVVFRGCLLREGSSVCTLSRDAVPFPGPSLPCSASAWAVGRWLCCPGCAAGAASLLAAPLAPWFAVGFEPPAGLRAALSSALPTLPAPWAGQCGVPWSLSWCCRCPVPSWCCKGRQQPRVRSRDLLGVVVSSDTSVSGVKHLPHSPWSLLAVPCPNPLGVPSPRCHLDSWFSLWPQPQAELQLFIAQHGRVGARFWLLLWFLHSLLVLDRAGGRSGGVWGPG